MRKIHIVTMLAAAAIILFSCSKEPAPGMKTVSVKLGCPRIENDTKTVIDGERVLWHKDDINIIAFTKSGNKYALTSTNKTKTAYKEFTGTIPSNEEVLYYYYDKNKTSPDALLKESSFIREVLNYSQYIQSANGFHQNQNSAIAKPGETIFRNVHGFFKWTNNGNAIKSVKFETCKDREYLAGWFDLHYDGADPVTTKYYYNESTLAACSPYVITQVSDSTIPSGKSYYAIVIPGTYHGLKLTITLSNGTSFAIKTDATVVVERGKYLDFGVLPIEPVTITLGSLTFTAGQDYDPGWNMNF